MDKSDAFFDDFDLFEGLKTSLTQALEYEKGNLGRCRVTVRALPIPELGAEEIARARRALNLSQRGLAAALGVSARTVEAWESGRNTPAGAARNLLYLLNADNTLLDKLIDTRP